VYNNVGKKIKGVARTIATIGYVISAVLAILLMSLDRNLDAEGILFVIGLFAGAWGCLISWLFELILYGFGQLVDNSDHILNVLSETNKHSNATMAGTSSGSATGSTYGTASGHATGITYKKVSGPASGVSLKRGEGYLPESTRARLTDWKNRLLITNDEYDDILKNARPNAGLGKMDAMEEELSNLKMKVTREQLSKAAYQEKKRAVLSQLK